jgi:hypothetical protein
MREALFVAAVTSLQMGVVVKGASGLTAAPVGMQVLYACTLFTFGGASLGYCSLICMGVLLLRRPARNRSLLARRSMIK